LAAQFLALPDFIDPDLLWSAGGAIMVLRKLIRYLGVAFVIVVALNLGAILGAAGVAGIAIGFAAQTSLSNIISGFFLIGERPFELGDVIEIDGISGTVDTIDLLSLTLRTFDNRSVRIPTKPSLRPRSSMSRATPSDDSISISELATMRTSGTSSAS
jgi:small-conductance mechanosensitive channel